MTAKKAKPKPPSDRDDDDDDNNHDHDPDHDEQGLGDDPLLDGDPLLQTLYRASAVPDSTPPTPTTTTKRSRARHKGRQPLPDGRSWRLVTFSFYEEDVARLDALLAEAKRRGHKKVSRSQLVRLALRQVDLSELPEVI